MTSTRRAAWVLIAAGIAGVFSAWSVSSGHPILAARWTLLWQMGLWAGSWLIAVAAALRLDRKLALGLILVVAVAIRVAALAGPPTTSDDLYRYAWDGQVQNAGIDGYAASPSAPRLAALHTKWLWPDDEGCAALHRPPGCTRINRPAVRTIYPPVAEAWFALIDRASGGAARHKAWQFAGLVVDLATVGLLAVALNRWGRDRRWLALYALSPAPALEFVNNAHVDGLAVALIVGALVVAARKPTTRWTTFSRDVGIGLLLGGAVLVKLYPALLLLAVLGLPRPRPWLSLARSAAAASALAMIGYLPHILAVGTRVLGYLPGYLKEEHYDGGGRLLLARTVGLSGQSAIMLVLAGLAGACAWVTWRRPDFPRAAALLLAALFLAATPVQPWYAVSLLAVATIAGWPWATALLLAGYPYFFAVILEFRHAAGLGEASYGAALGVALAALAIDRRRASRTGQRTRPSVGLLMHAPA